jgi:LacI family transcriptional regulator
MAAKATLKQLSEILGISISTVSRALKDHPDIAKPTKKKVRELAELLEYEPNALAVQLRTNASSLIGVIVPDISGFFYHSFIAGLESEARSWGYSLMILQSNDSSETEASNLKICRFNRTAGILVAMTPHTTDMNPFDRTRDAGTPIVFFDKVPEEKGYPKVTVADEEAGAVAAEAIIQSGGSRILALFGDPALSITRKRRKAFEDVFASRSPETGLQIKHAFSQAEAERIASSMSHIPSEKPDTVFCMSDEILVGVMAAVNGAGLSIPDDLSILALSNGFFPSLFKPGIAYVETSGEKLGRKSFEILHRCMAGDHPAEDSTVAARFVAGASLRTFKREMSD